MRTLDGLFQELINRGGSDLHLEQGQAAKVRVHGELHALSGEQMDHNFLARGLQEICPQSLWQRFQATGDVDFAYDFNAEARFRANCFRQFNGLGAIFRIIPSRIMTLEDMDAPPSFSELTRLRSGLVLVTGPTGSGKSTTLAAIIDYLNSTRAAKIVTIEEPVEFVHQGRMATVLHREVGPDTPSFASGLRSALKSDADVILVGEMRDRETIELALTASEMGMLVFGTLHTNSAAKTIDRIVDVFPAKRKTQIRSVLANSLKGIIAQQLLPSADGSRRWPAFEVLLAAPSLAGIIRSGDTSKLTTLIQTSKQMGMISMDDSLAGLVKTNKVAKERAYLFAQDKGKFQ